MRARKNPVLDIAGLPVFTLTCTQGLLAGQVYKVTDPGRAMISGIGRFKGPILRDSLRALRTSTMAQPPPCAT